MLSHITCFLLSLGPSSLLAANEVVCNGALTLTNTGNVRVDVASLAGTTGSVSVSGCTPGTPSLVLDQSGGAVTCGLTITTSQQDFEDGLVSFQAEAAITAKGTNAVVDGVTTGQITAAGNVTLLKEPRFDVGVQRVDTSDVQVKIAGDIQHAWQMVQRDVLGTVLLA